MYNEHDFIRDYNKILGDKWSLTKSQEEVVRSVDGPILVSAGPGSGKTECIVARTLRLLIVERAEPASIVVTTFTKKAARQLLDRMTLRLIQLRSLDRDNSDLFQVDLTGIIVGTIHSIAERLLTDSRVPSFTAMTIIDEIQLRMLLINTGTNANIYAPNTHPLRQFNETQFGKPPPWEAWVKRLTSLMNRITEDQIDLDALEDNGGGALVDAYEWYRQVMSDSRRLDFALLLDLILSELKGGGMEEIRNSIQYVMVDEYQDTNPIQEDLFFTLANTANLCVVGDDDQSLYRFRGASVECMLNFESQCIQHWRKTPSKFSLLENFRSHPIILDFYEKYMNSQMGLNSNQNRIRQNGKPALVAKREVMAEYPPVILCQGENQEETDERLADLIRDLEPTVEDWSQIAILSPSVQEDSSSGIGNLIRLLEDRGIPVYNPRGKNMSEAEEVMALFGIMSLVLDEEGFYHDCLNQSPNKDTLDWVEHARSIGTELMRLNDQVRKYVQNGRNAISGSEDGTSYYLLDVMFHILNLEPFVEWEKNPTSAWRLAQATKWIEGYSMTPSGKTYNPAFQNLFVEYGGVSVHQLNGFYRLACNTIVEERTVEHEEEEVVVVPGHISVMTIHQAKGLEFDIVVGFGLSSRNSASHRLPALMHSFFAPIRTRPITNLTSVDELRDFDAFRSYFVAFSRAKHALILHDPDHWKGRPHQRGYIGCNKDATRSYVSTVSPGGFVR